MIIKELNIRHSEFRHLNSKLKNITLLICKIY
jgi:hypothetical protein